MNSEIIHGVTYDNQEDFELVDFIFQKSLFHYFEDYLMTTLTLG